MRRIEKILRVVFAVFFIIGNSRIKTVSAANSVSFSGFGNQNIAMDSSAWDLSGCELSGDSIVMTDAAASGKFVLDISSISSPVDNGNLKIDFSADAFIADEAAEELDSASITIGFGSTDAGPDSTVLLDRGVGAAGTSVQLNSSAAIPTGTRFLFVEPASSGKGSTNSTIFSSFSLKINDEQNPTLSDTLNPNSWTNGNVDVTLTAVDNESGVEGIYNSENVQVSSSDTYTFTATDNGSWVFTSKDNSGKVSDPLTVNVTNIDRDIPVTPVLLVDTIAWTNATVPFTISAETPGLSPETRQFRLNEGEWQTYTEPATVDTEGTIKLDARTIDEAGNSSDVVSDTVKIDKASPTISVTSTSHPQPLGGATISVDANDALSGIASTKYAAGSQTTDYFTGGGGSDFSGATIDVTDGGIYTIFAQDAAGNAVVKETSVNTYPSLDTIADQTMNEDGTDLVVFSVSDRETTGGDLTVNVSSSNTTLFPAISAINTAGSISVNLVPAADLNGSSVITVNVEDAGGLVTSQNFNVTVDPVNDAPFANADTASTNEDTTVQIDVLANDTDVDIANEGDTLTIVSVGTAADGTVSIIDDGTRIEFTPTLNFNGNASFTYTIEDLQHAQSTANVTVTVGAVDDPPVISDISNQTINEDNSTGPLGFTITDVDTALKDITLSVASNNQSVVPDSNLAVTDLGSGNFTIEAVPAANQNTWNAGLGLDQPLTITITANDGTTEVQKTFQLSVVDVNDPPAAVDDSATTNEDTQIEIHVLSNDSDAEGDTLTIPAVSIPTNGSAEITGDGLTITYTPNSDYNGADSFTYTVSDGKSTSQATVNVTVESVNDAPVAVADSVSMNEDGIQAIYPLSNDSDPDVSTNGDHLIITDVTGQTHGTAEIASDGLSLTYTPDANWNGIEALHYTIQDDGLATASADITITVAAVNDAPLANNDTAVTDEDTAVQIDVLANDVDADITLNHDTMTIVSTTNGTNGTVSIIDGGTKVEYIPALNTNGVDTFTYTIEDSQGAQSVATVTVTVNPVDDPPVINGPVNQTIEEDHSTGAVAFSVSDVEGDPLTVIAVSDNHSIIPDDHIVIIDTTNGNYTIEATPLANANTWTGSAHDPVKISITADDGTKQTTAVFSVTINPVNDPPVVVSDSATTDEDTPVVVSVLANDSDIESDPLTVTGVGSASHGTVTITDAGQTVTYTPVSNYNGTDSFTYTASDGSDTSTTSVSITINSVNDAPVAVNDTVTLDEDTVTTINVLSNDTDVDIATNPGFETISIDSVGTPGHGNAVISNNKIVYTPDLNYNGTDTFTYVVRDIAGATATGTVNLTINPVNDYPVFDNLSAEYTMNEDESLTIHFNISDVETPTESLMLQVTSGNTTKVPNSDLVLGGLGNTNPDTTLTITPAANQNGDVVITLRLGDGFVVTVQTFILHITPVNDPPVAHADSYNFTEDTSIVINMNDLVKNDTDIDLDTLSFVSFDASSMVGSLTVLDAVAKTYTYTPPANFDQSTSFQYTMTDGTVTRTATVTLHAIPVNDPPTIVMDSGNPTSADEDTDLTLHFTIHDEETAASSLTVVAGSSNTDVVAPSNVVISCLASGYCTLVAQPSPNKNGPVTLTVSVSDGEFLVPSSVALTFNPVKDAPNAVNDFYTIGTNGSQVLTPLENDYDVDGDTFSITSIDTTGMTGHLVDNLDGTFTYTPPMHFTGTETFTYTITDSTGLTGTATVSLTMGEANTPPSVSRIVDQFIMEDNTTGLLNFSVTDAEGDSVTFTTDSTNPTLVPNDDTHIHIDEPVSGSGNYTVEVTPLANGFGTTKVTLTANDGTDTTSISFNVTVYPVNDLPVAVTDNIITDEDTPVTFNPVANDTDIETPLALTIVAISTPAHGWLTKSGANYTYTPQSDYHGTDNLTYSLTDGESVVTGVINITINSVNDPPVARNDWVTLTNTDGANKLIDVLANDDTGGDTGETLTIDSIVDEPAFGTAEISDGEILYTRTSEPGDSHDSFTYRIADSGSPTLYATATVYIADGWTPSISAGDVSYYRNEDAPTFTITLPVSNGIAGGYTLQLLNAATLGTTDIPDIHGNTISYTPNLNANGSETLHYKITSDSDGSKTSTANIYITLYPVNDLPTISAVSDQTIDEDTSTSPIAVTINDVDDAVSSLKFEVFSGNQDLVSNRDILVTRNVGDITFTISPIANRNGDATITMLASDSVGFTSESFNLHVNSINDPPTALDYSVTLNEDTTKTLTLIAPFADVEGDPLTLTIPTPPLHGNTVIHGDNTVTYTPNPNYYGPDSFIYQLDDGHPGGTDTGTVTITIDSVDDAPVISNLTYLHETLEDTPVKVSFNISDVDNPVDTLILSYDSTNEALVASSSISVDPGDGNISLSITPLANAYGEAIITVHLSDGTLSTTQQFKLVVDSVNDLPVANPDSTTTNEDTSKVINVVANDTDVEDIVLSVASVTGPAHGTVVNNRDGTVTYSPAHNWNGTDHFTYTIVDQNNGSAVGNVTVVVNPVNDAPNANTDTVNINEDTPVTIYPLANDNDVEGDPISLVSYTAPSKGVLFDNQDGSLVYTPNLDYNGMDSFTYVITDGQLQSTGTVNINLTAVNDAPRLSTSSSQPWTFNEDTPTSFPIHIYDPETPADNLVIRITSTDQTIIPDTSIHLQGSGSDKTLLLTPNLNKFGTLNIRIEATDGELTTVELFPVVVVSVNDLPTISNVTDHSIPEDTTSPTYAFTVSDIETAASDLTMTFTSANGTLFPEGHIVVTNTGGGNRTVQLTPDSNLVGSSLITLTVHDADGGTASDTFTMTVTPVNDPPIANNDMSSVNEDESVNIDVLANDTDVDLANEGDDLTIVSSAGVDNGVVTIAGNKKSLTFTPSANWNGTEVFTYTIRDIAGATSSASVTVTVNPVNDPPVAVNDTATTTEDHSININVLSNDTDIDLSREGDVITVLSTANVTHGSTTIAGDKKSITFTPAADWYGDETFDYTIEDLQGATSTAQVTVTVTPVNDPPVISDIPDQTIAEDTSSGANSFNVNDVDNDPATLTLSVTTSNGTIIPTGNVSFGGSGTDRTVTFTPVLDKNTWNKLSSTHNPVLLTVTVSDGSLSASDSFNVTVTPVNDTPVANVDSASVNEDNPVIIHPLTNDTDVDIANEGDSLTIVSTANVDNGVATIAGDGLSLTFTPDLNWNGTEVFSYTIQDSHGATATANITVTVNAVNDPPTIVHTPDQTINEDTTTGAITFTINDVDNAATTLVVTRASSNTTIIPLGNVVLGGSGSSRTVTITPAADKNTWNKNTSINNPVTITLTVKDASNASVTDTFLVTVLKVNDPPVANNDSTSVNEDGSVSINVLGNDTDVDINNEGDALSIVSTANVDNGAVTIAGDSKSLTFTPAANWNGTEVFDYTIRDIAGATSTASVTVTVNPVNDPPTISDIPNQSINEDTNTGAVSFTVNDIDNDPTTLNLSAVTANGAIVPLSGIVFGGSGTDRTVTVTPAANKNTYISGPVNVTVTVTDAGSLSASDSFTMTITAVNDPPTAVDDTAIGGEDSNVSIPVLSNDTDVDLANEGDSLTILSVAGVDNGTVSIAADKKTLTFTPAADWNGIETFTYTIRDNANSQSTANVTVTVTPVNDPPVANSDSTSTNEDNAVIIDVLNNDADVDAGDVLTIVSTTGVDNGSVSIASDKKTLTFAPNANWNGTEVFNYTIRDLANATSSSTVTVTVDPVNDAPLAIDDAITISEDQVTTVDVLANDTDVDLSREGDNLILVSTAGIDHGSASISGDSKTLSFTPEANWYGVEVFSYTMQDKGGIQSTASVTITVNAVNDPPVAVADNATTAEDTAISIDVLGNDTDVDLSREGDNLTILSVNGVDNGSVSIAADNKSLSFNPAANWNGTEVFNYVIKDKTNAQSSASVTVLVTPVNDPPVAVDDSATTNEDNAVLINVIANDTDVDLAHEGDALTVVSTIGVDNGIASISSDRKSILFTPDLNWSGTEVFSYLMQDSAGQSDLADVTVVVNPVNDSPVAVNDQVTIDEDHSVNVDVLTNDTDVDLGREGDDLTIKSVGSVLHGIVSIASDTKTLTYSPDSNWNGIETFAYTIKDKGNIESTANVIITVNPVNDPPHAVDDTASTNEDEAAVIQVLANDTDVDLLHEGDYLTIVSTSGVDHGSVTLASDLKSLTFTPDPNWNGIEEFSYTMQDEAGLQSSAKVDLTVVPQEDASVAVADTASVNEDGSVAINVLANDIDADLTMEGDNLTIVSTSDVDHGSVSIAPDSQSLTFTPTANWNGTEVFYYTMKDIANSQSTTSVTVTVDPVNDPPTAVDDNVSTNEDTAITISPLINDVDVDLAMEGDVLKITGLTGVDNGTAVISGDGKTILFTPTANWNGDETFSYSMEDKSHESSSANIKVSVLPVNDPPTISDVTDQTINEDTNSGPISFTLTDIDTPLANLTMSVQTGNGTIIPLSNIVFGGSDGNRTVSLTPAANLNTYSSGPINITLTVSDGFLTASDSFMLTVTPVNDPPVAVADTARLDENSSTTIDVLKNDTDVDFAYEGDSLSIVGVSGVDNATVQILDSGKLLKFIPKTKWFGTETFTYTIRDKGGAQSSANVTVTVDSVPEPDLVPITDASFNMLTPKAGEYYKDGQTIHVSWTAVDQTGVSYRLEFFDGTNWTTLVTGLTTTNYDHLLDNTHLHTNAAKYQVIATSTDPQSLIAVGDAFIIDNLPPRDVQVSLATSDRNSYTPGTWTNLPVDILVSGGWDLTGINLKLFKDGILLGTNPTQIGVRISEPGEHRITVFAVDPLGNQMEVGEYSVKIDVLPPAIPEITTAPFTDALTGGTVTFHFPDDPGSSGNSVLILPDGSQVKINGDYTWNSVQDGQYTFITIDLAGNRRTLIITVTGGKLASSVESTQVPDVAPPDSNITITDDQVQVEPIPQVAGGGAPSLRGLEVAGSALALLFLLLILFWPNVKIIYIYRNMDGTVRRVIRRKRVFTPNDKDLKVKVKDAEAYEVQFNRSLTRSMRGGNLQLEPEHVNLPNPLVEIPDNAKNEFKSRFKKSG